MATLSTWMERLRQGLRKTREQLADRVRQLVAGRTLDESLYEDLEETLILADVGVVATRKLLEEVRRRVKEEGIRDGSRVPELLKEAVEELLEKPLSVTDQPLGLAWPEEPPLAVLVVGVNGSGKTTTVAKLAQKLKEAGEAPLLAAADTFRAAAAEQLEVWGDRLGVPVIRQKEGADPAAVAFDALQAAKARGKTAVLVDTAGRLHTESNLMAELKKIRRVMGRALPGAPHEVLLVLDGTMGQNALQQARLFHQEVGVTGVVLTKLDGSARGGVAVAVAGELGLPVRFVGVGEKAEDLQPFSPKEFAEALFT
ncbi:MAG: signal recognition particle-docking protein FtsY [Clostridiales bacterium]|nr:signal recognition particle-docking protein FtsY [Clostridiales bacterium]